VASELQQNRYDQLVRRVGGIIGPGSKVSEALTELFPVIDVEQVPLELLFLAGTTLGQGATNQSNLAGNLNHSQLFNPVRSGQLIVPTYVSVFSGTAQIIEYTTTITPLTTETGNVIPRDTRAGLAAPVVGQTREVQQVGGLPETGVIRLLANVQFVLRNEGGLFVLAPGTGLTFANTTANTDLLMNYMWRERVALESELNF